jgi:lactate dehydrogenase-like 2-hydroxyacid dehydrogenase
MSSSARVTERPRVVVTRRLPPAVERALTERFDTVLSRDDHPLGAVGLQRALAEADVLLCTLTDRITAEVLSGSPRRVRLLASFGAGVDHIDLAAADAYGVTVTNTPDVLTDDTADLAIALLLATLRRMGEGERQVRGGRWTGWRPTHLLGRRATGISLGIVGLGRIGLAVARRAHAGFGMQVLGTSRTRPAPEVLEAHGIIWRDDLGSLLPHVDALSLHVPGGPDTASLIGAREIALLQPGSVIVNTARGGVVETEAMIAALMSGHLAGVGLDVYPGEPDVDRRLLGIERAVLMPHLGSATREGREAMGMRAIANIEAFFRGEEPPDRVG